MCLLFLLDTAGALEYRGLRAKQPPFGKYSKFFVDNKETRCYNLVTFSKTEGRRDGCCGDRDERRP